MKAVVFKNDYRNYKKGEVFFVDSNFSVDSWLAANSMHAEGHVVGVELSLALVQQNPKAENLMAYHVPYRSEYWSKEGQSDLFVDPQDSSWEFHPAQSEKWEVVFKPGYKEPQIEALYQVMVSDVYAQMYATFGTNDPNSANAYKQTWDLMVAEPSLWVSAGLTASFDRGGLSVGEALDTEQKVLSYASACVSSAVQYGIWRMQRIEQFRVDRQNLILGE